MDTSRRTRSMKTYSWYSQLIKPSWAPPAWLFGPAWSVLYSMIAISFGNVFLLAWQKNIPWIIALPFILNLIFNVAFTSLQFGLRSNGLAAIDILLVLITLIWATLVIYSYANWIAFMQIPYLLWVCFATILQLTVTYLNR